MSTPQDAPTRKKQKAAAAKKLAKWKSQQEAEGNKPKTAPKKKAAKKKAAKK